MASTKIKLKMVFYVLVVLTVITFALGFVWLGINIYGARFYVFGAIACFLMLVVVHSILRVIFNIIDDHDKGVLPPSAIN